MANPTDKNHPVVLGEGSATFDELHSPRVAPPSSVVAAAAPTTASGKPSLNAMTLAALQSLQATSLETAISARMVRDWIAKEQSFHYAVQTLIVVLNRFVQKGLVHRAQTEPGFSRQRYAFFLTQSLQHIRDNEILERFTVLASDYFEGNIPLALQHIKSLLSAQAAELENAKLG
jgi:hypothetical protein